MPLKITNTSDNPLPIHAIGDDNGDIRFQLDKGKFIFIPNNIPTPSIRIHQRRGLLSTEIAEKPEWASWHHPYTEADIPPPLTHKQKIEISHIKNVEFQEEQKEKFKEVKREIIVKPPSNLDGPKKWSPKEEKFLIDNFHDKEIGFIAAKLGKTVKGVQKKIERLKLKKKKA